MTVQSPPPPPPPPAPAPPRKGMSPLAWIGIGCGVILILAMIAVTAGGYFLKKKVEQFSDNPTMAAAELVVRANPELELVSKDEGASTLTIRNKKTGEVVTFSAEDAKEGRWSFKTDQGTATFDTSGENGGTITVTDEKGETATVQTNLGSSTKDLPSWVPTYPGGSTQGSFDTMTPEGRKAAFAVTTPDPPAQVLAFYEAELKKQGLAIQKSTYEEKGKIGGGSVTGTSSDSKRTVSVFVSPSSDTESQAVVTFVENQ